ncbi:putative endo-beta-1,4-glucanase D [Lachnellula occidentalis]|uniref:AA9 family lytic polysaccharide monooxygenase n=1 Tax=Lachnellula occidentalis TaxID=215460 RepID=A0A8H8S2E5_9HELO|nr:putative endo-beta-1,4-glucanase D [Lachnellula occidentalis]
MRILTLSYALAALQMSTAHTVFTTLFINEVNQSPGTCVRMPMTPNNATFPINDLKSDDMACGYGGTAGVARVCAIPQAAKLDFLFVEYADNSQPGAIDTSHKGPCAVYMKRVDSAIQDKAIRDGWFKIWEDTYDAGTLQWCTEKLIKNNGMLSVQVPENLAGGYYLIRPELLALHQAGKNPPNPQFYVGCAQIFLNSTATSVPKDTVKIPGYVGPTDPAVLFNIYTPKWPYPTLGPALYEDGSNRIEVKPVDKQSEGLLPYNIVAINANWWALELESYSTSDGCKNATKVCSDLTSQCYNSAPPTGSKGCRIWEAKCTGVRDACNAGNFNGPPQKNKILTPGLPGPYLLTAGAVRHEHKLARAARLASVVQHTDGAGAMFGIAVTTARPSTAPVMTVTNLPGKMLTFEDSIVTDGQGRKDGQRVTDGQIVTSIDKVREYDGRNFAELGSVIMLVIPGRLILKRCITPSHLSRTTWYDWRFPAATPTSSKATLAQRLQPYLERCGRASSFSLSSRNTFTNTYEYCIISYGSFKYR